jgi:DNA anti-recombination protein RmuC
MADKNIPFYIKKAPQGTSYYSDTLVLLPPKMATEYEFDGHGFPSDEVLKRDPYFNIPKVEKLEGKKLQKFIDETHSEISRINTDIENIGRHIETVSSKIDDLIKKREKMSRGSYKYVMATKDIDELAEKLPPLDEEIKEMSVDKKRLTIELLNAQAKYVDEFFEAFKSHEAFSKIPKIAEQLIEENAKAVEAYQEFTEEIPVGYTSSTPFLNTRVVGSLKSCLVNYEDAIDEMKANTANRYLSQIQKMFEEDFRSKVRAEAEE